jgi:hypothetical protein
VEGIGIDEDIHLWYHDFTSPSIYHQFGAWYLLKRPHKATFKMTYAEEVGTWAKTEGICNEHPHLVMTDDGVLHSILALIILGFFQ